jgi:hypothetical protein
VIEVDTGIDNDGERCVGTGGGVPGEWGGHKGVLIESRVVGVVGISQCLELGVR